MLMCLKSSFIVAFHTLVQKVQSAANVVLAEKTDFKYAISTSILNLVCSFIFKVRVETFLAMQVVLYENI